MFIIKRDNTKQVIYYDKITTRNSLLASDLNVDTTSLSQSIIKGLSSGMSTRDIDKLSCENAIVKSIYEPDYAILAARIAVDDLHKSTLPKFSSTIDKLYNNTNPLISKRIYDFAKKHIDIIEKTIDYKKDHNYSYFGFKTLEQGYLQKINNNIVERPQDMLMRISLGIHGPSIRNGNIYEGDIQKTLHTYNLMSDLKFTHASPTLFNSGTNRPQFSSCFLLSCPDSMGDSIYDENEKIVDTFYENSIQKCIDHSIKISKNSGGIGITLSKVRERGSYIAGSNGRSSGLIPLIRVLNNIARYVDQGGKRMGAISVYLDMTHPDIPEFLEIKLPNGAEELRARDIFPALFIPDLFFKRLEKDEIWSFFCPNDYPELVDFYGVEYEERYIELEKQNKFCRQMKTSEIMSKIVKSLTESGTPYMLAKDHINNKSNHQNVGTITSSNLCVHPDTMILTEDGYYTIKSLENSTVNVWNGEEFSEVVVKKTGFDKKLIRVNFSSGDNLICTQEHGFYLKNKDKVMAKDLKPGVKLISYDLPILEGNILNNFTNPYTVGYFSCMREYILPEDRKFLLSHMGNFNFNKDLRYEVPINATVENKINWLSGLLDNYGEIMSITNLQINLENVNFLKKVRYMLQTLGIQSTINCCEKIDDIVIINYMLNILSGNIKKLINLGLVCNRLELDKLRLTGHSPNYQVKVESIELETGIISDTYCFTEKKRGMGIFNGVCTSNCTEIMQYHDPTSIAVCNLASISLPKFVVMKQENKVVVKAESQAKQADNKYYFDFKSFGETIETMTDNLNLIIDKNFYPVKECYVNNIALRPIGLGVQGLADVFAMLGISWGSIESFVLNRLIFEVMYYHALKKSHELAVKDGPYSKFQGSPVSKGILQYDMWNTLPITSCTDKDNMYKFCVEKSGGNKWMIVEWMLPKNNKNINLDWGELKKNIMKDGVRNSLLVAPMPTASTSNILGNNEAFEAFTSNIYTRKILSGNFPLVNKHLYKDLKEIDKWNKENVDSIISHHGSVQQLNIPDNLKDRYKIVSEMSQKIIIDMAADRGAFIDQSQSMNIVIANPTPSKLSSMYLYAWKKGLKTLSYYLRSQAAVEAIKFTIMDENEIKIQQQISKENENTIKPTTFKVGNKEYTCSDGSCCSG